MNDRYLKQNGREYLVVVELKAKPKPRAMRSKRPKIGARSEFWENFWKLLLETVQSGVRWSENLSSKWRIQGFAENGREANFNPSQLAYKFSYVLLVRCNRSSGVWGKAPPINDFGAFKKVPYFDVAWIAFLSNSNKWEKHYSLCFHVSRRYI